MGEASGMWSHAHARSLPEANWPTWWHCGCKVGSQYLVWPVIHKTLVDRGLNSIPPAEVSVLYCPVTVRSMPAKLQDSLSPARVRWPAAALL